MYKFIFSEQYQKRASKFLKKHPDILQQYIKTLELLETNPYHPSLRLHLLKGKLSNLHSVSINMSYRITIQFIITKKAIIPISIGTHNEAYK